MTRGIDRSSVNGGAEVLKVAVPGLITGQQDRDG